jgi:hypothetical protein
MNGEQGDSVSKEQIETRIPFYRAGPNLARIDIEQLTRDFHEYFEKPGVSKIAPKTTPDSSPTYLYNFATPLDANTNIGWGGGTDIALFGFLYMQCRRTDRIMSGRAFEDKYETEKGRNEGMCFAHYEDQQMRNRFLFLMTPEEKTDFAEWLVEFNGDIYQKEGMSYIGRIAELLYRAREFGDDAATNVYVRGHIADIKRCFDLFREGITIEFPEKSRIIPDDVWEKVKNIN